MGFMPDKSIDCVLTDPPYDFSDEMKRTLMEEFRRVCKGAIIIFCPPENQWVGTPDQYLFWVKPISTKNTSRSYSRFVEMIFVWNGPVWNADGHWSQYTNVFTDLVDGKLHPYQKPTSLISRLVRNHTNAGDVVFDPFMGSGTVGAVCQSLDRNFVGCEINETNFIVANNRTRSHEQN